jgi:hypothetical protein
VNQPKPPWDRFIALCEPAGNDLGCLRWKGFSAGTKGPKRPVFRHTTRAEDPKVYAFRWAYEQVYGEIAPGLELDHTCKNSWCVNWEHGEPVPPDENSRRTRLDVCRAGLHDLGDPANVRWDEKGRRRGCLQCWLARKRERYANQTRG